MIDWSLNTSLSSYLSLFHVIEQFYRLGCMAFYKARITRPFRSCELSLTMLQVPLPAWAVRVTRS